MTPKFKGDDDDWLDDQDASTRKKNIVTKKGKAKGGFLDPTVANATVAEVFPNQCAVILDDKHLRMACTYRKAKLPHTEQKDRAPVAVGDRVLVEKISNTDGVIDGVCTRRNELVRPSPERATRHVLVANVDVLAIVAACVEPPFSPGLVDRFLIAALAQKIDTVICVTKMDLWVGGEKPWQLYQDLGFKVVELSVETDLGIESLNTFIHGRLTTFCGHSGVGKTSLLNKLLGKEVGRTGDISQSTGKGQHTTTGAYLIADSKRIDTPGIRAFGLTGIDPDELKDAFPEFRDLACQKRGCFHRQEESCDAQNLPRYSSYRRILESLLAGEN
jgi:ribosome biogenesis GTPase